MNIVKQRNKHFSQLIHKLLFSEEVFLSGDIESLQDTFVTQVNDMLPLIFDLTVKPEKLNNINIKLLRNKKEKLIEFITSLFESDEAYIIMNYYYAGFITAYFKQCKKEHIKVLADFMNNSHVRYEDFSGSLSEYKEFIAATKTSSQASSDN